MQVKINGTLCNISVVKYVSGGHPCLKLTDASDGMPYATATLNLPKEEMLSKNIKKGEVIIKDYFENTGMYNALLDANIITKSHRHVTSGFTVNPVCYLVK